MTRLGKLVDQGKTRIGMLSLPQQLNQKLSALINNQDRALFKSDIEKVLFSFWSHGKANSLPRTTAKANDDSKTYEPHILTYGKRESIAYTAIRLPVTYTAIASILHTIIKKIPTFNPQSLLDYGCGPATASLAVRELYPDVKTISLVDLSADMLEIGFSLLEGVEGVTGKRHLMKLRKEEDKRDLVIAAFSLNEIASPIIRHSTLEKLWEYTNDTLIVVERGTPKGFEMVSAARKFLLDRKDKIPCHIVAPCTHDLSCPMTEGGNWCHFSQRLERNRNMMDYKKCKSNNEDVKFSYFVIRKGDKPAPAFGTLEYFTANSSESPTTWQRLVSPPIKKSGHIIMDSCSSSGTLQRFTITKNNSPESDAGKDLYTAARKAHWHDLWPEFELKKKDAGDELIEDDEITAK